MIPWKIKHGAASVVHAAHYCASRWVANKAPTGRLNIHFVIPEYGITGGSLAVIYIANLLATDHNVSYERSPFSPKNRHLSSRVRNRPQQGRRLDCCVIESGTPRAAIQNLMDAGVPVLITNHGYPVQANDAHKNYALSNESILEAFRYADMLHFISLAQKQAFDALAPITQPHRVIQNGIAQVQRHAEPTGAVGVVCDTRLPLKNVQTAVLAAEASKATAVHVWGRFDQTHGTAKTVFHGFSNDKTAIYSSFDVLVLLSYTEVQPLCVLEAISCGMPCVLSDLPCYLEFRGLPGFWFVPPNDAAAATQAINEALAQRAPLKPLLVGLWENKYAPSAVKDLWVHMIDSLQHASAHA